MTQAELRILKAKIATTTNKLVRAELRFNLKRAVQQMARREHSAKFWLAAPSQY